MAQMILPSRWCRVAAGFALAGALVCGGMQSIARGADAEWPRWRGPNQDDMSPDVGLLKTWPEGGPKLVWKLKEVGNGFSSISIAGGKIFTMGEDNESSYVHAIAMDGSKKLWSTKVGRTGGGGGYPGPRCTPTVDGEYVYAVGQFGDLVCLQAATGAEVWRKSLDKDFAGKMHSGWGFAESPLVDGEKLIVTPGGKKGTLLALNKLTGETIWRCTEWTDNAAYTGAVAATLAGKKQYVQLTADSVAGVEPETGKLLWRADRKGQTAVIPTPIVADDCVYVTSGYGIGCDQFKITLSGAEFKAANVYSNKVMVNHHGGVILKDGKLYGYSDGKGWTCQDFKTGDLVWKDKEHVGKGTISYADGMFYLRDESKDKGTIALIDATATGYKEHGRFELPDRSDKQQWPHMVILGGKLYIRDQGNLFCYDVKGK